ncbi:MAG TPA: metalloregulator ArsR/SmtB family transcription factor [Sorangium sp.]|nr:metalloregulator ArsR/SmtB family transcription factor [Sorangium sp.]
MPSSEVFEVLADPTRRLLVEALLGGERAVGELVELVSIQQSGVSRHLRILGEAGFVAVRAEGTKRLYSLRPEPFRQLDDWVGRYRSLWEKRLDRFGEALEAKRAARKSGTQKGRSE